jgi:hypothetical protein
MAIRNLRISGIKRGVLWPWSHTCSKRAVQCVVREGTNDSSKRDA